MKDDAIDFSQFRAAVARALLGEPTHKKGHKYYYGSHGSLVVDVQKGVWHDFENNCGGGVIDLIMVKKGVDKSGALDFLAGLRCIDPAKPNSRASDEAESAGPLLWLMTLPPIRFAA